MDKFMIMSVIFLCASDNLALPPYKPYDIAFQGPSGMWTYTDGGIIIFCYKHSRMVDVFPPFYTTLNNPHVFIGPCQPTNYIDELKSLNINTTIIKDLTHRFQRDLPLPRGNYTAGLKITQLSIENNNYRSIFENNENFFDPLSELTSLYANGIEIPLLPETMKLVNLTLVKGAMVKSWGNCIHLKRLELYDYDGFSLEDFPIWPSSCDILEHLAVEKIPLPESARLVLNRMIAAAPSLKSLVITSCRLNFLPKEMIASAKNLSYLKLEDNQLYDELFMTFPFHKTLKKLDISSNLVRGYGLGKLTYRLPALKEFVLKHEINFYKTCLGGSSLRSNFIEPLQNSTIEALYIGDTQFHLDCFNDTRFKNLKRISMSSPSSVEFKLLELPKSDAGRLTVDFTYHRFGFIVFKQSDYKTLQKQNGTSPYTGHNLTVLIKHVKCDCDVGWLVRALSDFPHILSMPDTLCDNDYGVKILEGPKDLMECNMTRHNGCTYRQNWRDGRITAECDKNAWIRMEPMFPLYGLNVSRKRISNLHSNLPETIKWLDLRHNRISRASDQEAASLFAAARRVWLADNLLLCDCDNRALIDAIQQHQEQVEDYNLLKCVGTGEAISVVSTAALCQIALSASFAAFGILVLLISSTTILFRRYGDKISMYLYSRGCCVSCLRKVEFDDKPYDAFLSFAHEDHEFVVKTLLPGLENCPERFHVCVHYRDWQVGNWIPDQIMHSVQQSRRTLILLSRNFVTSPWSTLEFRYALTTAAEEINAKMFVLVLDDVLDTRLSAEIRRYVTYNTYLRCDDPLFWEKLRYAMPHRASDQTNEKDDNMAVTQNTIPSIELEQLNYSPE